MRAAALGLGRVRRFLSTWFLRVMGGQGPDNPHHGAGSGTALPVRAVVVCGDRRTRPSPRAALLSLLLFSLGALPACNGGATADEGQLWVANLRSSEVTVIDLASGQVVSRRPAAPNPHELVSAGGAVWTGNYRSGSASAFRGEAEPLRVDLGGEPHGLAALPASPALPEAVALTLGRAGRVLVLDAVEGTVLRDIETGGEPHMVTAHPGTHGAGGGVLWVAEAAGDLLLKLDPVAGSVSARVPVGRVPEDVALSPDGRLAVTANARSGDLSLVDTATLAERRIEVPGAPVRARFSPDGRTIAAALNDAGSVALIDVASGEVRDVIPSGVRPDGIAFSPDGNTLYVALSGEQRIAVLHLGTHPRLRGHLPAGDGPSGLLLLPGG